LLVLKRHCSRPGRSQQPPGASGQASVAPKRKVLRIGRNLQRDRGHSEDQVNCLKT